MCRLHSTEALRSLASQMRVTCHSAQHGCALVMYAEPSVAASGQSLAAVLRLDTWWSLFTGDHPGGAGRRPSQHGRVAGHGLSSPRGRGHRRCGDVSGTAERACSGEAASSCAVPASSILVEAKDRLSSCLASRPDVNEDSCTDWLCCRAARCDCCPASLPRFAIDIQT